MKTLLVYTSKHGTTEKIAEMIQEQSQQNIELCNLKDCKKPDINEYSKVIIGTSFHAGRINSRVKKFIKRNKDTLLIKKIAIYVCGMNKQDINKNIELNFNEEIRKHAFACDWLGGEFLTTKMNGLERAMVKKVAGVDNTISEIKKNNISEFITAINNN